MRGLNKSAKFTPTDRVNVEAVIKSHNYVISAECVRAANEVLGGKTISAKSLANWRDALLHPRRTKKAGPTVDDEIQNVLHKSENDEASLDRTSPKIDVSGVDHVEVAVALRDDSLKDMAERGATLTRAKTSRELNALVKEMVNLEPFLLDALPELRELAALLELHKGEWRLSSVKEIIADLIKAVRDPKTDQNEAYLAHHRAMIEAAGMDQERLEAAQREFVMSYTPGEPMTIDQLVEHDRQIYERARRPPTPLLLPDGLKDDEQPEPSDEQVVAATDDDSGSDVIDFDSEIERAQRVKYIALLFRYPANSQSQARMVGAYANSRLATDALIDALIAAYPRVWRRSDTNNAHKQPQYVIAETTVVIGEVLPDYAAREVVDLTAPNTEWYTQGQRAIHKGDV